MTGSSREKPLPRPLGCYTWRLTFEIQSLHKRLVFAYVFDNIILFSYLFALCLGSRAHYIMHI